MIFATFALLIIPAIAAPSALTDPLTQPHAQVVQTFAGEAVKDHYLITVKDGVDKTPIVKSLGDAVTAKWDIINGFASTLDAATLLILLANPDVLSIDEDGIIHPFAATTQTDAPWGLARISQRAKLSNNDVSSLTYRYTYISSGSPALPGSGSGVDVYVIDTGILTTHTQFGGRAKWGATFGGYANADGNGHGTHCAGTIAGSLFGVAKAANIIAVKVLSDSGSGRLSDMISGMDWVQKTVAATRRPSVASMSVGGPASTPVDNAVAALTASGVHVAVAAGNDNVDAANTSPARAPSAITVGASSISDAMASFSNYGPIVDIFAPGVSITSAWIGSNTATNRISGTSMATPHVAGLVAYIISTQGNKSPAAMATYLKNIATKNVLSGLPKGTANTLAFNSIS